MHEDGPSVNEHQVLSKQTAPLVLGQKISKSWVQDCRSLQGKAFTSNLVEGIHA